MHQLYSSDYIKILRSNRINLMLIKDVWFKVFCWKTFFQNYAEIYLDLLHTSWGSFIKKFESISYIVQPLYLQIIFKFWIQSYKIKTFDLKIFRKEILLKVYRNIDNYFLIYSTSSLYHCSDLLNILKHIPCHCRPYTSRIS